MIAPQVQRRITQQDIVPGAVKQRHIQGFILFRGLEADLPDGSTEVQFYFATDTDTLYIWNPQNNGWNSVAL